MASERAAVRLLTAYWDGWLDAFPQAHRRAQWHIIHHLCAGAPQASPPAGKPAACNLNQANPATANLGPSSPGANNLGANNLGASNLGAPMAELLGLTRQALLLDDSTVRDRVQEMAEAGDVATEPAGAPLAARTVIIPRPSLLARYDQSLLNLLVALDRSAADLQPGLRLPAPTGLPEEARTLALETLSLLTQGWSTLLDRLADAGNLSAARRMESRRNLLSTSHRTVLLMAIEHHYGLLTQVSDDGILADRLAAHLLQKTGQNFQTTRDHIAYLLNMDLLERRPGRALSVALAPAAVPLVAASLLDMANALAGLVRRAGAPEAGGLALRVNLPGEPPRLVPITCSPFTIGRTEGNSLRLPAGDVSRTHCQITLRAGQAWIEDLESTNGTELAGKKLTAPAALADGATLVIGPFELTFLCPEEDEISDSTIRRGPGFVARAVS